MIGKGRRQAARGSTNIYITEKYRFQLLVISLAAALLVSMLVSITFGSVHIDVGTVWRILFYKATGLKHGEWAKSSEQIVWMIRAPRIIFTVLVGGGLAVIGAVMQAVVRNTMADPYILGMSAGASTGASFIILSGTLGVLGMWVISFAAFLGALAAFSLVFFISSSGGRMTAKKLILSGVAVSYLFSAVTSFLTYLAPDQGLREVTYWLLGSVASGKWNNLPLPAVIIPAGFMYLFFHARHLNSISMGEETAVSLGLDSSAFRKKIFLVTSLMTGVLVALSGSIGFVGLMVPHIVRLLCGSNHKNLLPLSMLSGALFLIWADVLARTILSPMELPIGIITAICGAPFFIWVLQRSKETTQ